MGLHASLCHRLTLVLTSLLVSAATSVPARADELWYASLRWDGGEKSQRFSRIHSIRDDGTDDRIVFDLGGDTTYPVPSSDGDWLHFQVGDSPGPCGHYTGYRARVDGSSLEPIGTRHNFGSEWSSSGAPTLASNGSRIIYGVTTVTGVDTCESRVVIAKPDGTSAEMVAFDKGYSYMGSLDRTGQQIVFANPGNDVVPYELLKQSIGSTSVTRLTPNTPENFIPQFTPDGRKIIFKRGFTSTEIWWMDADGANAEALTRNSNYDYLRWNAVDRHGSSDWPDISSDGKKIAYIARKHDTICSAGCLVARNWGGDFARCLSSCPLVAQVHTMDLETKAERQITSLPQDCARARFSPDGQQIAFVSFVGDHLQLFVTKADGSGTPRQLTRNASRGVFWVRWKPSNLMTVRNLTTRTTLFSDDFEHVPDASRAAALDATGDYDPLAITGNWTTYEAPYEAKAHSMIQVTRSTSGGDPGSLRGGNYLRLFRSMADGVRGHELVGTFNPYVAQPSQGDVIRWSMMVHVPADGANARATFALMGTPNDLSTARAWIRTDGAGRVIAVDQHERPVDSGVRYTPGAWERWDVEYKLGANVFSLSVNGATKSGLPVRSAGIVTAFKLINGNDTRGSFYIGGVVPRVDSVLPTAAFKVKNVTSNSTVFSDDFGAVAASHMTGPDLADDFDPIAKKGHWDVYEAGPSAYGYSMIQVTDAFTPALQYGAPRSLRVYRSIDDGLNEQDVNAVFSNPQTRTGDLLRWSMMVYLPNDGANARSQFALIGTPNNFTTARAWVRPDGAGNVVSVGPGYALTNTGVRYAPGTWQRWDIEYAVGGTTFAVAVNGVRAEGLPVFSAGTVGAAMLVNGNTTAGSFYLAGVPGE